jgi:hypothetical protein
MAAAQDVKKINHRDTENTEGKTEVTLKTNMYSLCPLCLCGQHMPEAAA